MLKTGYIQLITKVLEDGRYLLSALDAEGDVLEPSSWKNLLFSRHEESYYGTVLEIGSFGGTDGVIVNGWQLVSLFAHESFNRFVHWDWSNEAEVCLAAAHSLYEGILEKDWLPDFSAWENGNFRWQLPERVKNEFDPSFWDQPLNDDDNELTSFREDSLNRTLNSFNENPLNSSLPSFSEEPLNGSTTSLSKVPLSGSQASLKEATQLLENKPVFEFISHLYNDALEAYLTRNPEMKKSFGPKLALLKEQNLSARELSHFFDENSWLEWVGIKESPLPFTIGLRLDEPEDGEGFWLLEVFLRGKKNQDLLYRSDDSKMPAAWKEFSADVEREQERWLRLLPWLGVYGRLKTSLSEEEAWLFLTEASVTLLALNVEILLPSWWQAMQNANLKVKASVKGTSSHRPSFVGLQAMLDFNWRFSMNGVDLSEEEFSTLVEEKRRLVFIRGRWVKLDPQFIRHIQEMMKKAEKEGLQVRDLLEQELLGQPESEEELDNPLAFSRIQIEINSQWKKMMKQLSEVKEIPLQSVPAPFQGELRPYQHFGMSWLLFLRQYGFGALLADDMGLGKTVQLISYLQAVQEQEPSGRSVKAEAIAPTKKARKIVEAESISPTNTAGKGVQPDSFSLQNTAGKGDQADSFSLQNTAGKVIQTEAIAPTKKAGKAMEAAKEDLDAALIICPTSVLGNWQKELERFAPEMDVYLHYGSNRLKGEAFFEKIRTVDVVLTSYGLSHLDSEEFHAVRWSSVSIDEAQNIKNAQTKQSRAVRALKGRHHIALTGTPMENRLTELWSIFDFTNHGYLGSLGQFQKRFVIPIEKEEKKEKVQELQSLIRPFLLRRTKKDEDVALNLPDKQEQKEYCPLTAEQASLYEQLVRDTFAEIEKLSGFERKGLILQMLSKLKQLCNHPALYLKEKPATNLLERSTKMEKLSDLVESVLEQGESCLIFTQYIEMGEMIRTLIKKKFRVEVPFLNGSVPKARRDQLIEQFQNREFPVFLLSLKAGGTGLNLTAANHVIHYDRWWNPAVENQATDRAYRIGQQRFVHVHKMISTGTLEEKIDAMLEKKQFLNDQIIQSENWITELSTDDLRDLVYLK